MSYRDRPKWLTVGRWQPVFPGYVRLLLLRYVVKHVVYFKALKLTFSSTGMSHRLILKFVYFVSLHLNTSYTSLRQTIRLLLSRVCLTYTYALKSLLQIYYVLVCLSSKISQSFHLSIAYFDDEAQKCCLHLGGCLTLRENLSLVYFVKKVSSKRHIFKQEYKHTNILLGKLYII